MTATTMSGRPGWSDARRRAAIVAASVALHALVLTPMAFRLFETDAFDPLPPPEAPIFVEMEPRPLLVGETSRVPVPAPTRQVVETRPLTGPAASVAAPRKLDDEEDTPTTPVPRAAGAPPAGAPAPPAGANPWAVAPESLGAAVGRTLRTGTGGCRIMDGRLGAAEQALCDERFNEAAAAAGRNRDPGARTLTPSEQRRETGFALEGARALQRYEARRAPLRGGVGVVGPADCIGSNFGTGCAGANLDPAIRQGATSNVRQDGNKTEGMRPIPGNE